MKVRRATITAVGHYVPDKVLTNTDLERMVDTSDEWITKRTGISERRIQEKGVTSDLAVNAIQQVLANRGMSPEEIEAIVVATVTPDMFFPSTACVIQEKIGATNAWGFDLSAGCSGFLFALSVGAQFIESGMHSKVMVVGADKMSSIIDYTDRTTCILFGDGAGAALLEPAEGTEYGILDQHLYCDGAGGKYLYMKGGGSLYPATHETVDERLHYLYQDGEPVFKSAVTEMANAAAEIMERNNLKPDDVAWLVPHQANSRIIYATVSRMGLDRSKVTVNIDKYGNTTDATIPLCLSEWWHNGLFKRGQNIILAAFGAGYTWGGMLIRWSIASP